jgi:hypothetical protein
MYFLCALYALVVAISIASVWFIEAQTRAPMRAIVFAVILAIGGIAASIFIAIKISDLRDNLNL